MRIVNISYRAYPTQNDPLKWIDDFRFFTGIWEALAIHHEVISFEFIDYEGTLQHNGVTYLFRRQHVLGFPVQLNRRIARLQPDVVMVHGILFPLQLILLRVLLGQNVLIIIQHHAEQAFRHPLKCMLQRVADRFTAVYFFTALDLAEPWIERKLIAGPAKVTEIMEVSSVFEPGAQTQARNNTQAGGTLVYLWVGHLNSNKDPMLVVRAFTQFIIQEPGARLYLVFQSTALLAEIQAWLEQHPLAAAAIVLVGRVVHAELQHWYSSADFIISSSHEEGSGTAVCEAMSCHCIPILSDIPSFRFMTDNGACGLLYRKGNTDDLLAALVRSRQLDRVAERLKVQALYQRKLSFKAIAAAIQQVLDAHSPGGS